MSDNWNILHIRIRCPECLSIKIKEVPDKSNVLFYGGIGRNVYGKKYICLDCKYEWKPKNEK